MEQIPSWLACSLFWYGVIGVIVLSFMHGEFKKQDPNAGGAGVFATLVCGVVIIPAWPIVLGQTLYEGWSNARG